MTQTSFADLGLSDRIVKALTKSGYAEPSPIQAQAIPHLVEGKDLFGCAQTGTGKTAGFALPVIQRLLEEGSHRVRKSPRALVLAPTRELAAQVADSFRKYAASTPLKVGLVHGGVSFGPQKKTLNYGVDILVATPGRLMDLTDQGYFEGERVMAFVLDEADRMLDMGFSKDVEHIAEGLSPDRQTILFSATISKDIEKFARTLLHDPVEVRVSPEVTTAEKIDQQICFVKAADKRDLLVGILEGQDDQGVLQDKVIVFTKTKYGADKLCKFLIRSDFSADAIHGDKSQAARKKALSKFTDGRCDILVATDVAARGIDIKSLGLVVNYELPMEAEAYVHRIGRTARAGATGMAVSFCGEDEFGLLKDITKLIEQEIPVFDEHEFHSEELQEGFSEFLIRRRPGGKRGGPRGRNPRQRRSGPRNGEKRDFKPRGEGSRDGGPRGPRSRDEGPREEGARRGPPRKRSFQKGPADRSDRPFKRAGKPAGKQRRNFSGPRSRKPASH
ncbi:MAG: DEAD/DEAH box helicase [Opitutales bacterium]